MAIALWTSVRKLLELPLVAERSCQNHRLNSQLDSVGASLQDVFKPKANAIASGADMLSKSIAAKLAAD